MATMNNPRLLLLDLDGTLADTAADLGFALNELLGERGREPLAHERIRPVASGGSPALIRLGFDLAPGDDGFESLQDRFLELYAAHICTHTRLFPGMEEVLAAAEATGRAWGVVTNKPGWLTNPLVDRLGLTDRAACVVSGDTVERRKPWPDPLLHACEVCGVRPDDTLYVGDDRRDIEAARRATIPVLAATWGYIAAEDDPVHWGADAVIDRPGDLLRWLPAKERAL